MAKQDINIGAIANDGTGDPLRDSFDKTNDNFTELYNVNGWGVYGDSETSPSTQSFNTTPSQLLIDGSSSGSTSAYLPYEIRGISELWSSNKLTPIGVGDSYDIRVNLTISSTTSNPTRFAIALDIGATPDGTGGAGSVIISQDSRTLKNGVPQNHSFAFPIFSLATFLANGCTFWIAVDSGSLEISSRSILIVRTSSGQI